MAPVIVQQASNTALNANTVVVTLGSTPTAGNLLIAGYGGFRSSNAVLAPLTWAVDATNEVQTNVVLQHVVSDGSTTVFTFTPTASAPDDAKNGWIAEVSGLTGTVDKTNNGSNTSASPTVVSTAVTTSAVELWVALLAPETNPSAAAATNSWIVQANIGGAGTGESSGLIVATKIVSAIATPSTSISWTATGGVTNNGWGVATYVGSVAAFLAPRSPEPNQAVRRSSTW